MSALLSIHNLQCEYDGTSIIRDLHFELEKGTFGCILGPSGCGKTTLLRAIAGFEPVIAGEIVLRGVTASSAGYTLAPEKRRLGMVFQDYALFPHMDVLGNIGFGLRNLDKRARLSSSQRLLDMVGLQSMGKRYPHELSGGQQQRVALARALAARPDLILMDEPFSNLDVKVRERLSTDVRDILKSEGIAAILVTHDQQEAFVLADQIGVLHQGRIVQWDAPFRLYHEPADRFVAQFVGQGVFVAGTFVPPDAVSTEMGLIRGDRSHTWPAGTQADVLLRPDDLLPEPQGSLRGTVVNRAFKGASILYTLRLPSGASVLGLFPSHHDYHIGESVGFEVAAQHLIAFPR